MSELLSRLDRLPLNGSLYAALVVAQTLAAPACPVLTTSGLGVCQEVHWRAPA